MSAAIILACFAWLALPLIPALRELRRPQDAAPLAVFQGNAADAKEPLLSAIQFYDEMTQSAAWLDDETMAKLVKDETGATLMPRQTKLNQDAAAGPLVLAGGFLGLEGRIAQEAVHAPVLKLGADVVAQGHLSAEDVALVEAGAVFRTLQAGLIVVGYSKRSSQRKYDQVVAGRVHSPLDGAEWQALQGWWRATGGVADAPLVIGRGLRIEGDIVSNRHVWLEAGAAVDGSIKSLGQVRLAPGAAVGGSIVADDVVLERDTVVRGSIVADKRVDVGSQAAVGEHRRPATVAATDVRLYEGCWMFGGVTAHREARALENGWV